METGNISESNRLKRIAYRYMYEEGEIVVVGNSFVEENLSSIKGYQAGDAAALNKMYPIPTSVYREFLMELSRFLENDEDIARTRIQPSDAVLNYALALFTFLLQSYEVRNLLQEILREKENVDLLGELFGNWVLASDPTDYRLNNQTPDDVLACSKESMASFLANIICDLNESKWPGADYYSLELTASVLTKLYAGAEKGDECDGDIGYTRYCCTGESNQLLDLRERARIVSYLNRELFDLV